MVWDKLAAIMSKPFEIGLDPSAAEKKKNCLWQFLMQIIKKKNSFEKMQMWVMVQLVNFFVFL